jgi:drug/metabolite transporter (DMT)-like permease
MLAADRARLPTLVLLFSSSLWGISWWPLQRLASVGVQGPALAMLTYGAVGLCGLPLLWRQRAHWLQRPRLLIWMMFVGGWAAASFVMMLATGDVVREMLLFYLAPAWSILGARVILGEAVRLRRGLGLALALVGAFLVILASGSIGTQSISTADWLALSSGLAFAANNLTARATGSFPVTSKVIASMLGCALLSALAMVVLGQSIPAMPLQAGLGLAGFALVWTFAGTWTTSYGVTHLQAGRAALIILSELVVALISASLVNQRTPSMMEMIGGVLILAAATIDAQAS